MNTESSLIFSGIENKFTQRIETDEMLKLKDKLRLFMYTLEAGIVYICSVLLNLCTEIERKYVQTIISSKSKFEMSLYLEVTKHVSAKTQKR